MPSMNIHKEESNAQTEKTDENTGIEIFGRETNKQNTKNSSFRGKIPRGPR